MPVRPPVRRTSPAARPATATGAGPTRSSTLAAAPPRHVRTTGLQPSVARSPVALDADVKPPAVDGVKWMKQRLDEIKALTAAGKPVTVVFDLDNTLFDTRSRTLLAGKRFDQWNHTAYFKDAKPEDMMRDGIETGLHLGLPKTIAMEFQEFWAIQFWTPSNLAVDRPMNDVLSWAKKAKAAGATVKYLTGRTTPFHDASVAALNAAGMTTRPEDVLCKPNMSVRTTDYKVEQLQGLAAKSTIGFFLTESRRDLAAVVAGAPAAHPVALDSPFERGLEMPAVPVLPSSF